MNLSSVVSQLVSLFLMMLVGYISARAGLIDPKTRQRLSTLTISSITPLTIISSVIESGSSPSSLLAALLTAIFFYILMIALAALIVRIVPSSKGERGFDELMLLFTNVAFMGIPVIDSVYGTEGVAQLSMFVLVFNALFFSYGVFLVSGKDSFRPRQLVNPCIIAAIIALFLGLTGLRLPAPVETTLNRVGGMNTPMAMMVIGSSVAHSDIRQALRNRRLHRICLLRMFVMPAIMLALIIFLPINGILAGICVLLAAMPIAANCGIFSDIYTPDDMTASQSVVISTFLSGVTLPIFAALVLRLF